MKTLRVAIVVDRRKLPVFKKALKRGGFTHEMTSGMTKDTLILTVETTDVEALAVVVKTAAVTAERNRKLH